MTRWFVCETRDDEQSKRVRKEELAVVRWSAPSGEKRSLDVDDDEQQKKQCTGERVNSVCLCLLHCQTMDEILAEWPAKIGGLQEVTTEQLLQGAAKKGNEKGSNGHGKSLIWAARDTEWKKLEEKGAVRITPGASAEKAKAQFGCRFNPSRFVVTRPGPE